MKSLLPLLAGLIMLAATPARAQVATCTRAMAPIQDGRLQAAVDALRAKYPGLVFQADDTCRRAKSTSAALTATLRRNYLKTAAGFQYVKVVDGDGYFTLERFRLPKPAARKSLVKALAKCPHCKLRIPENTCMAHFVADDSVVFMISAASACKTSRERFQVIEEAFQAAAPSPSPPP